MGSLPLVWKLCGRFLIEQGYFSSDKKWGTAAPPAPAKKNKPEKKKKRPFPVP
jgi:hypothetical protein